MAGEPLWKRLFSSKKQEKPRSNWAPGTDSGLHQASPTKPTFGQRAAEAFKGFFNWCKKNPKLTGLMLGFALLLVLSALAFAGPLAPFVPLAIMGIVKAALVLVNLAPSAINIFLAGTAIASVAGAVAGFLLTGAGQLVAAAVSGIRNKLNKSAQSPRFSKDGAFTGLTITAGPEETPVKREVNPVEANPFAERQTALVALSREIVGLLPKITTPSQTQAGSITLEAARQRFSDFLDSRENQQPGYLKLAANCGNMSEREMTLLSQAGYQLTKVPRMPAPPAAFRRLFTSSPSPKQLLMAFFEDTLKEAASVSEVRSDSKKYPALATALEEEKLGVAKQKPAAPLSQKETDRILAGRPAPAAPKAPGR